MIDNGSDILTGWKSIAGFLHVSVKHAHFLEKKEKLPIARKGGNVFATKDKLKEWIYETNIVNIENITQ